MVDFLLHINFNFKYCLVSSEKSNTIIKLTIISISIGKLVLQTHHLQSLALISKYLPTFHSCHCSDFGSDSGTCCVVEVVL